MVKKNWIRADIDAHSINRKHAKENIQYVLDAKEGELNSLIEYNVFNRAENHGQDSAPCNFHREKKGEWK